MRTGLRDDLYKRRTSAGRTQNLLLVIAKVQSPRRPVLQRKKGGVADLSLSLSKLSIGAKFLIITSLNIYSDVNIIMTAQYGLTLTGRVII